MDFLKTLKIGEHELHIRYDYYPGSPATREVPEDPEEYSISSVALRIAPGEGPGTFLDISTLLDGIDEELVTLHSALQEACELDRYDGLRERYYGDE